MQLITIAGASGSGKTTLAEQLASHLPGAEPVIIALDAYYYDTRCIPEQQRGTLNFDHPDALESGLLIQQLLQLLRGEPVQIPIYDFKFHVRSGYTSPVTAIDIIILEGIYALYWAEIRALSSHRIFVDTSPEACFSRRFNRDQKERGRNADSIVSQWQTTVEPMFQTFALPTREFATQSISGEHDFHASVIELSRQLRGSN